MYARKSSQQTPRLALRSTPDRTSTPFNSRYVDYGEIRDALLTRMPDSTKHTMSTSGRPHFQRLLLERPARVREAGDTPYQSHSPTIIGRFSGRGGDQVLCKGYCEPTPVLQGESASRRQFYFAPYRAPAAREDGRRSIRKATTPVYRECAQCCGREEVRSI